MSTKSVYNLEFPSRCPELNIFGYRFYRVNDYRDKVKRLQHLISLFGEFEIPANGGENAVTAFVEKPRKEKAAVLEWSGGNATALNDILLLLSIFTQRDVFDVDTNYDQDKDGIVTADPRLFVGGGILRASIPYQKQLREHEQHPYDIGFENGLNKIYELVRNKDWQRKYHKGYFLFLVRTAFRRQPSEATFIQCWTIWEHLFAILNQGWLSEKEIRSMSSSEKISFLLVNYALRKEITPSERKRINQLADIRNRLVHYGRFPIKGSVNDDAMLFTRLTEFIIARILDLSPSNLFNTLEQLEKFLSSGPPKKGRLIT